MTRLYPGQNIPAWEKTCVRCLAKEERRKKKKKRTGGRSGSRTLAWPATCVIDPYLPAGIPSLGPTTVGGYYLIHC